MEIENQYSSSTAFVASFNGFQLFIICLLVHVTKQPNKLIYYQRSETIYHNYPNR